MLNNVISLVTPASDAKPRIWTCGTRLLLIAWAGWSNIRLIWQSDKLPHPLKYPIMNNACIRYGQVPKMDDYWPSVIIHMWMIFFMMCNNHPFLDDYCLFLFYIETNKLKPKLDDYCTSWIKSSTYGWLQMVNNWNSTTITWSIPKSDWYCHCKAAEVNSLNSDKLPDCFILWG